MSAKLFFSRLGWFLSYIFVGLFFLIKFSNLKRLAKKYLRDSEIVDQDSRFTKVYKLAKTFLYLKQISIKESGNEKISDKPMLFIANHRSDLDPIVIFKLLSEHPIPRPIFVAKIELSLTKIAPILDLLDVIYIDRNNLRELPTVIENQIDAFKNKNSVVIFPEGTRNIETDLLEFKPASFSAAYESFVSIQPFVLSYEDNLLKKSVFKTKDRIVKIKILDTIKPIQFVNVDKTSFSNNLHNIILKEYIKLKNDKQ